LALGYRKLGAGRRTHRAAVAQRRRAASARRQARRFVELCRRKWTTIGATRRAPGECPGLVGRWSGARRGRGGDSRANGASTFVSRRERRVTVDGRTAANRARGRVGAESRQ